MSEDSLEDVIRTISVMIEVEKTVGHFYRSCSEVFFQDSDFWKRLSDEEALHADVLAQLARMIARKPHKFEPGKLFSTTALRTFISRILSDSERLKNGDLTMHNALLVAYHLETTIIEYGYTRIVGTDEPKYLEALENLEAATIKHRGRIKDKMQEYGKSKEIPPAKPSAVQ
ncbi:MAG: hypothetical protein HY912_00805 [Desulfomonile tiedjei]|uniref:Rubrerythrin diiron-binding domain-containing protein n=1 Tax=Desulfomonile tiedjei TaxID=2358 RepID=A0A9D6V0X5_9BACT|nr:hypothetical protein [Desulfomonile tiedjei]